MSLERIHTNKKIITREQYVAAIPKCCAHQTMEAHESIMLCGGLVAAMEHEEPMNCDGCPDNTTEVGAGGASLCACSSRETAGE